jgi:hypothetical protein
MILLLLHARGAGAAAAAGPSGQDGTPGTSRGATAESTARAGDATTSATWAEPRFAIEAIEVEGLRRASSDIVISESTLVPGREYSEEELRQAVYRINRLPFVVQARFSLRKGSSRGLYVLVVEVEETERLFFGLDERMVVSKAHPAFSDDRFIFSDWAETSAGARQFVGARGVLYGSVTETLRGLLSHGLGWDGSQGVVTLGYTQYGLLDRPLSLSMAATWQLETETLGYSVGLGLQLPRSHSLRLEVVGSEADDGTEPCLIDAQTQISGLCRGSDSSWKTSLEWRWDTTDDIVLPSRGRLISGLLTYASDRYRLSHEELGRLRDQRLRSGLVVVRASWFWPARPGSTFETSLGATYTSTSSDLDFWDRASWYLMSISSSYDRYGVSARMAWLHDIWRSGLGSPARDLRWESWAEVEHWDGSALFYDWTDHRVGTGLVFRNRWGVLRAGISYRWQSGSS